MWTLAIETTGLGGSVALLREESLVADARIDGTTRSAVGLAPLIERLLTENHFQPGDLGLIGVIVGPGSFTGLRVGLATAKTLAYALNIPLCGVETPDAIALLCPSTTTKGGGGNLHLVVDAQRDEVFHTEYLWNAGWLRTGDTTIKPWSALQTGLPPGDWLCGPAVETLLKRSPAGVSAERLAPREYWAPRAVACGLLAIAALRAGKTDDPFTLGPRYLRPSYAEEKRPAD